MTKKGQPIKDLSHKESKFPARLQKRKASSVKSLEQFHELTKKICIEDEKQINLDNIEFDYAISDFKFDKCPICLKTNVKDMEYSCEKCSAYICKFCFVNIDTPKKCPLCKELALRQNSFKEKMLLEHVQAQCPKCNKSVKFSDNFAVVKHKLECFMPGWILDKLHGETHVLDDLVDCLIKINGILNGLPSNFLEFVGKIEKETNLKWNIFVSKCSSSHTKHYLSIQKDDWREYLTFFI